MKVRCMQCGNEFDRAIGYVNRSAKIGAPLYCSMTCSGLARRNGKTVEQKKAEKSAYDRAYRLRDPIALKQRKSEYYQRTHDPDRERIIRAKRMHLHVEYCRQPRYKEWKREYDANLRASEYGEYGETYKLLLDLEKEIRARATLYERLVARGYYLRSAQKRRREAWKIKLSSQPQI